MRLKFWPDALPSRRLGGAGRGLVWIMSGTVGAQLVAVSALPLLSRLYSPTEFGYFSVILAISAVIAPAATLRFETAAMLPEHQKEVQGLAWNALLSSLGASLLTAGVLQACVLLRIGDLESFSGLPLWVGITVLLSAAYAVFSQLALRKQQYALVSTRSFARAGSTSIVQGVLGAWSIPDGLMIGAVVGNAVGMGSVYRGVREYLRFPGWPVIRGVWRSFWRFPAVFAPSQLLNSLGLQAPVIFFVFWFGVAQGGQLGMAERIAALPLALVGAAVSQVVDAEVSKLLRDRSSGLQRAYARFTLLLLAVGMIAGVGFATLALWVIPWLLGDEWMLAAQLVQVLALTSAVRLVASPLSRFLVLLQQSAANLVLDLVRVLLMLAAMLSVVVFDLAMIPAAWIVYSSLTTTYALTWLWGYVAVRSASRSLT